MPDEPDMNEVITRGTLNEALGIWAGAIVAQVVTQLRGEIAAMADNIEDRLRATLADDIAKRLSNELRRHTNASKEELRTQLTAVDDQYKDLPPRVRKLEEVVFAPKRKRR